MPLKCQIAEMYVERDEEDFIMCGTLHLPCIASKTNILTIQYCVLSLFMLLYQSYHLATCNSSFSSCLRQPDEGFSSLLLQHESDYLERTETMELC